MICGLDLPNLKFINSIGASVEYPRSVAMESSSKSRISYYFRYYKFSTCRSILYICNNTKPGKKNTVRYK